jgi:hypothetical protein
MPSAAPKGPNLERDQRVVVAPSGGSSWLWAVCGTALTSGDSGACGAVRAKKQCDSICSQSRSQDRSPTKIVTCHRGRGSDRVALISHLHACQFPAWPAKPTSAKARRRPGNHSDDMQADQPESPPPVRAARFEHFAGLPTS